MRGAASLNNNLVYETDSFTGAPNNVWANTADVRVANMEELDIDAVMNKRAAENIIADRPIYTMDQLQAVPYVGPAAMIDLRDYVLVW